MVLMPSGPFLRPCLRKARSISTSPLEDDGEGADDDAEKLEVGGEEEVEVGVVSLLTPSAVGGCMGTVVVTGSDSRFMYKPPLPLAVMSLEMSSDRL